MLAFLVLIGDLSAGFTAVFFALAAGGLLVWFAGVVVLSVLEVEVVVDLGVVLGVAAVAEVLAGHVTWPNSRAELLEP